MHDLFDQLDEHWRSICSSSLAPSVLERWQRAEPLLLALPYLRHITSRTSRPIVERLAALAARGDEIAQVAILHVMTPGLVLAAQDYSDAWDAEEAQARTVAIAVEEMLRPDAPEVRGAGALVRDVRRTLARHAARDRTEQRLVQTVGRDLATAGPAEAPGEELCRLVDAAVAGRALSRCQARLLLLHRLGDVKGAELAPQLGYAVDTIRKQRQRAEAALRVYSRRVA